MTKDTATKDSILKFNKFKVGHRDVENIAESIVYKQRSGDKSREAKYDIVKDLMKHRLRDALKYIKYAKTELNVSKDNLNSVVRKGTFVRKEFMEVVDNELKHVWNEAKEKDEEKVNGNIKKRKIVDHIQEGTFKGILVGDKELDNFEKEMIVKETNECKDKAVVYGGIKLDEKENEILCLPPDHTVPPK